MDSYCQTVLDTRQLNINGQIASLVEIEAYLHSASHPDPYVHQNQDQKNYATWYFHKHKNGTYKGGTFKGMDLILGNEKFFFGILIRTIRVGDNVIEGPCNCVNYILKTCGKDTVKDLVDSNGIDVTKGLVTLIKSDSVNSNIISGPRIGLSDKYPEWKDVKYRYVSLTNSNRYKVKQYKTLS